MHALGNNSKKIVYNVFLCLYILNILSGFLSSIYVEKN